MVISDLCHLEEVSEVSSLVEGGLLNTNSYQSNFSMIKQLATATASSYSIGGPAIATASSSNLATVGQANA